MAIFKSRNGESGNWNGEREKQERGEKPESLKTGTRNIASIKKILSHQHCEILIHAFGDDIIGLLAYCNSLLIGLPQHQMKEINYNMYKMLQLVFLARGVYWKT
jgi:hypothetical protein